MLRNGAAAVAAVWIACVLDLMLGDPQSSWHPICLIGTMIAKLEKQIRRVFPKTKQGERAGGTLLVAVVVFVCGVVPYGILWLSQRAGTTVSILVEAVLCYFLLAAKSLKKESMKVGTALEKEGLEAGRRAVSRIVGRDTQALSEKGVIKAAVETVAENFSDGVFAPLFYMFLGGAVGGFIYKGINTMDSMLGYKNETYLWFGRTAAKLDDIVNFIPSRLAGLFLILAAPFAGLDGKKAWQIFRRDRKNHASPNSAQTEAAAAGALHVRLAGDAWYFGKLYKKPYIGDDIRPIEIEDIRRVNHLMYAASFLALVVLSGICLCAGF